MRSIVCIADAYRMTIYSNRGKANPDLRVVPPSVAKWVFVWANEIIYIANKWAFYQSTVNLMNKVLISMNQTHVTPPVITHFIDSNGFPFSPIQQFKKKLNFFYTQETLCRCPYGVT